MGINRDRDPQLDGDDATPGAVNPPPRDCRVGPMTSDGTQSTALILLLVAAIRISWRRRALRQG
jgi:hypothetical protein